MKAFDARTEFGRFSFLAQRHPMRAACCRSCCSDFSISVASAQITSTSQPSEHVYLLRGAFNVFSLGMDQIAARLKQHGIRATVDNYLAWPTLAEQAAAEYKNGQARTIILVGHSSGAMAVTPVWPHA